MAYRSMVQKQVRNAIRQLKDLAVEVTLIETTTTTFNFNTKEPNSSAPVSKVVKGMILSQGNTETVGSNLEMEILLSSEDIGIPDIYDKAVVQGAEWTIVPPYKDDGYLVTLKLARGS